MNRAHQHYKSSQYYFGNVNNIYKKLLKRNEKKYRRVMDIGCGSGGLLFDFLEPLLPSDYIELVGTDRDSSMINYCESINGNPKIHFEELDITEEKMPEKFLNRFNLLVSSYCFMYVPDIRKGLSNCRSMLKNTGEVLLVYLSRSNYLLSFYKKMYEQGKWVAYTEQFKHFEHHFSTENREKKLLENCEKSGLKLLYYSFEDNLASKSTRRNIFGVTRSMDAFYKQIPEEEKEDYNRHFVEHFSKEVGIDFSQENVIDEEVDVFLPSVIIHATRE